MTVLSFTVPSRSEAIAAHRARGGRVAAVLPIHSPRALLRAFGMLPVEVWGPPQVDATRGAAHLPPYVCSVVRNALSFLETGGLDVADLIVVPHTCDSLQGLGSVLLDFVHPKQRVLTLYLPRGTQTDNLRFLADEFRSLYRSLEQFSGRAPSTTQLMESIRREEAADAALAELHRRRADLPLTDLEFYRLVRAREYLPAETFCALAHVILSREDGEGSQDAHSEILRCAQDDVARVGVPILLSGIVPEPMSLFNCLEAMGAIVVADDFACCGRRLYPPGRSEDPFERMAESILAAPPDPTRGSPIRDRVDHLLQLARSSGAKGIVFYEVKFCEPEAFDLPILRRELQAADVASVSIEVDLNDPLSHQVLTRLEAFVEVIA